MPRVARQGVPQPRRAMSHGPLRRELCERDPLDDRRRPRRTHVVLPRVGAAEEDEEQGWGAWRLECSLSLLDLWVLCGGAMMAVSCRPRADAEDWTGKDQIEESIVGQSIHVLYRSRLHPAGPSSHFRRW